MRISALLVAGACLAWAQAAPAQVQFRNVAGINGSENPDYGKGAAMIDLDGDGLLDLICANSGPNEFLQQQPDRSFVSVKAQWGIAPETDWSWAVVAADFDNDGDPDVYFANGGTEFWQANQLLRNDLDTLGVFTDVSAQSGDADYVSESWGASALDFDRDGLLDLFVADLNRVNPGVDVHCRLLRNTGDLVFEDVSTQAGITHLGNHYNPSVSDVNNDGWPDIGVGNSTGANRLYVNNRDGTFTEVAAQAGIDSPLWNNFGVLLEDFDNDGWVDALIPKWQPQSPQGTTEVYLNNGDGTFRDVTAEAGLQGQADMGHNTGDVNGDGFPDIYLGTGSPQSRFPDLLYLVTPNGVGGLDLQDVSDLSGINADGDSRAHGPPFGDYDFDGDLDFYVNNGGPGEYFGTNQENYFFENLGVTNHWFKLNLEGIVSNRGAIGARAEAKLTSGRSVWRQLTAGRGFGTTDAPTMHFGLAQSTQVDHVRILWPSGIEQYHLFPIPSTTLGLVETGLRAAPAVSLGETLAIEVVGKPGRAAELFFDDEEDWRVLADFGGYQMLKEPAVLGSTILGADGTAVVNATVPNLVGLVGTTWYLQAWVHEVGTTSGGLLTSSISVLVQS